GFPTVNPYDSTLGGSGDAFASQLRLAPIIPERSVASAPAGEVSSDVPGGGPGPAAPDERECTCYSYSNTQGRTEPFGVNTRTGNFDYTTVDLSIPTLSGPLVFQRTYATAITNTTTYTTTLGPGWTHNQDVRLIFPNSPGGEADVVWFKSHSASQYRFDITTTVGVTSYLPYAGVQSTLD